MESIIYILKYYQIRFEKVFEELPQAPTIYIFLKNKRQTLIYLPHLRWNLPQFAEYRNLYLRFKVLIRLNNL